MNTIDLVAIVPFYVEILLEASMTPADGAEANTGFSSQSLRAVRLVRIFRLFKIGRHVTWLRVFAETYVASMPPLIMIVFIICIVMVFLASLVHAVEASIFDYEARAWMGHDGDPSSLVSIPDGFWFSIVTMTTVGYGDITPRTALGKLLGMIGSLVGIIVLAVPISVISLNFHDKYEAQERKNEQRQASRTRIQKLRKTISNKEETVKKIAEENEDTDSESKSDSKQDESREAQTFRTVVSLMHAAAERSVHSMNADTNSVLAAEEHNRINMKHEIKSMLEQWEPYKRVELIKRSKSATL